MRRESITRAVTIHRCIGIYRYTAVKIRIVRQKINRNTYRYHIIYYISTRLSTASEVRPWNSRYYMYHDNYRIVTPVSWTVSYRGIPVSWQPYQLLLSITEIDTLGTPSIDGPEQGSGISSALAMEIPQSCAKLLIYYLQSGKDAVSWT